jgi:hypothetical protein
MAGFPTSGYDLSVHCSYGQDANGGACGGATTVDDDLMTAIDAMIEQRGVPHGQLVIVPDTLRNWVRRLDRPPLPRESILARLPPLGWAREDARRRSLQQSPYDGIIVVGSSAFELEPGPIDWATRWIRCMADKRISGFERFSVGDWRDGAPDEPSPGICMQRSRGFRFLYFMAMCQHVTRRRPR